MMSIVPRDSCPEPETLTAMTPDTPNPQALISLSPVSSTIRATIQNGLRINPSMNAPPNRAQKPANRVPPNEKPGAGHC